jgi:tripartite-type tricarboxylate transporter receptor subunit TctC
LPVKSVAELIAYAKERPGTLHYASFGNGSSPHLGTELLKTMTGINIVHVPYKGGPPALADLLGGQIAMMFMDLPPTMQHIRSGRVRALAMSTPQRTPLMPDLPTMAEAGVTGFGFTSWAGLVVPAGTAAEIVNRLHDEVVRVLGYPDVAKQLSGLGADPVGSTPQQFAELIKSEIAVWAKVVKDSGAKVD